MLSTQLIISMTSENRVTLQVDLDERSYPIYIGKELLSDSQLLQQAIGSKQVLVISNETIAPLYLQTVFDAIRRDSEIQVESLVLKDGERYKTLDTISLIYDCLMELHFDRSCCLVALGGGVVGDMTGYAAATYRRGVKFCQLPTTLLAQVDSSVGGKTGVNHVDGKNMIGAFHQPTAVVIDTDTLETLPERELVAGIAEVIKYGLISDKSFLDWLAEHIQDLLDKNADALAYAIERSCENKASVVASDEREAGIRAILNLGHTFGHAFETATEYKYWLHGEAVGFGMLMALDLSQRMGMLSERDVAFATEILRLAQLPQQAPESCDVESIRKLMSLDKKVSEGQLRLVLLKQLGEAYVSNDYNEEQLDATLHKFLS